jgi:membrane-bound ClpP family serine protease
LGRGRNAVGRLNREMLRFSCCIVASAAEGWAADASGGAGMPRGFTAKVVVAACAAFFLIVAPRPSVANEDRDAIYKIPRANRQATPRTDDSVLMVSGIIGPGAHRQFQAALWRANPRLVVLDGPGGVLGEAILIAEEVRRRGLSTVVTDNRSCASACAIVFLSGRTKYMGSGANVGLHSASYADGRADPEATQLMAAYLSQLGVPDGTLRRMARTAPSDIRWLTQAEQRAIGIRPYAAAGR